MSFSSLSKAKSCGHGSPSMCKKFTKNNTSFTRVFIIKISQAKHHGQDEKSDRIGIYGSDFPRKMK